MINVALVDDHALLRSGLANVINGFGEYKVVFEADNGRQFIDFIKSSQKPDVVLMDIAMPEMDGFETTKWLKDNAPDTKVLVLSMTDDENAIIRMLQNGAKGYILKDSRPEVLRTALREVSEKGFYLNEVVSGKLMYLINKGEARATAAVDINEKEKEFLKWCCTEKSYKEIANEMGISTRAVETLRSNLFERLGTLSRVGLVMYAIRNGIVKV